MQTEKSTHNLTRDQTPNPMTYSPLSDMLFYYTRNSGKYISLTG